MSRGRLILIPSALSQHSPKAHLSSIAIDEVYNLKYFIAERAKTARHFLKSIGFPTALSEVEVVELNKHGADDYQALLNACLNGHDIGLMSEAGAPGVADPGAGVVFAAHKNGIKVVPLVGPSSILLALMASGMNGQKFTFHGYLPRDTRELTQALKALEHQSRVENMTQIFIETPYRNEKMKAALFSTLQPSTLVSIAADITSPDENIRTLQVKDWRKIQFNIDKKPAVFMVYAGEGVK